MRIQILELPAVVVGEMVETPFVIVLDQSIRAVMASDVRSHGLTALKEETGARAVVEFRDTVEIVR